MSKIAVKREGTSLGWHWITRASFNPAVHVLHDLEARSDGLDLARLLDELRPRAVRIDLGSSDCGRAIAALPAIDAVARRFPRARFAFGGRRAVRELLSEHLRQTVVVADEHPELHVDLRPSVRRAATWDARASRLRVPACPYPWRLQHASAHFSDGAISAGLPAESDSIALGLSRQTRLAASRLVRERAGLGRPLVAALPRAGGWGKSRFAAVLSSLRARIGAEVLDIDALDAPLPVRAAALALCAVCVGDSGGLAHVAAAAGAPIVAIHGRACPLRHGPASRSGAAVFARCRDSVRHRPSAWRDHRCLECLSPTRVIQVAEGLAAEHWPRDWLRRILP